MLMIRRSLFLTLSVLLICISTSVAADKVSYEITVNPGDRDHKNVSIRADLIVPESMKDQSVAIVTLPDNRNLAAQLTTPSLLSKPAKGEAGEVPRQLCFVLDELKAGKPLTVQAHISSEGKVSDSAPTFKWLDTAGKYSDLVYGDRTLLRYMYEPLDESSANRRGETYKVYHHVFDPSGKTLLTKGPGGLFPHHRGLFYGFNRISYGDKKSADTWHCTGKAHQTHDGIAAEEAGPVLGRHVVKVGWHGQAGEVFADEERELTVYRQPLDGDKPTGTLIEFASRLKSRGGEIKIDGDPQHAGFQFRASQEVPDKTKDKTYYLRVDGIGKPGEFRNWPDQKDQVNFPWKGLSFVLGDNRYTVVNIDRPENPKESRFSERDYGRFGSYFQTTVTEDKPLELNYRIWVQPGEMTLDEIDALAKDFTDPVKVSVKKL